MIHEVAAPGSAGDGTTLASERVPLGKSRKKAHLQGGCIDLPLHIGATRRGRTNGLSILVDDARTDPVGAQTVGRVSQEEEVFAVTADSGAHLVNTVAVQFVHALGFCPCSVGHPKADEQV